MRGPTASCAAPPACPLLLLPAGDNVATATAIAQECGILPPRGVSMPDWLAQQAATTAASRSGGGWFGSPGPDGTSASSSSSPLASMGGIQAGSGEGLLPEGVVMQGAEFRQRVLRPDGSINAGAPPSRSPLHCAACCTPVFVPPCGKCRMHCCDHMLPLPSAAADEFLQLWPRLRVLARCTPADKYTIVIGGRGWCSRTAALLVLLVLLQCRSAAQYLLRC